MESGGESKRRRSHKGRAALNETTLPQSWSWRGCCAFYASQAKDEEHTDGITADTISGLLQDHQKDPFFLAAGFYRLHVPCMAPSKYFDMFPLDKIDLIPFDEAELRSRLRSLIRFVRQTTA